MGTKCLLLAAAVATAVLTFTSGVSRGARNGVRAAGQRTAGTAASVRPTEGDVAETAEADKRRRVVDDATGAPVAGARVTLYRANWRTLTAEPIATVLTDAAGHFDGWDAYLLVVEADGYPISAFDPDDEEGDLHLCEGTTRTFAVVDQDGLPCAAAQVDAFGDWRLLVRLFTAQADTRGMVTIRVVPNEYLLVRSPGCGYVEVSGTDTVVLSRAYTIAGQVVDSAGAPVCGARVTASRRGGG